MADVATMKVYRQDLMARGYAAASIAHKLKIVHRLSAAAIDAGLRADHPAVGVRPPRGKRAPDDVGYLSEGQLLLLLRALAAVDLDRLLETAYLFCSPRNAARLMAATERALAQTEKPISVSEFRQRLGLAEESGPT